MPLPGEIKTALGCVSPVGLRDVVKSIAVPRVFGTPENEAIRRVLVDLFSSHPGAGSVIAVDEAGNVVACDPHRARILIGAHCDAVSGTPGASPAPSPG